MRKLMKLALDQEQITIKSKYTRFDGYEIHLYGNNNDDFELAKYVDKPIVTVHYPISRCDVNNFILEYDGEYAEKVFDLCKKHNAGLVLHAETGLDSLMRNPKLESFYDFIRQQGVHLHIENCYRNCGAVESLRVCQFLQSKIGENLVHPLLDTCHLIMSEMSFKFEEMSFFKTIDAYSSDNFVIHLNDCIGSGERESGGLHGTNFYANQYLLWNILWKLKVLMREKNIDIDLVLEVDEVNYLYPANADALAKNVDSMWSELEKLDI